MDASIICVGNELLTGLVENSNTGFLARRLTSTGIAVRESIVIADDEDAISSALLKALETCDLVIITGGLGPTEDDLTREAVASTLNLNLLENRDWLNHLESFFKSRGITMPINNRKQSLYPEGGILLENKRGTAPGILLKNNNKTIVLLPGPPQEMKFIFDETVLPALAGNAGTNLVKVKTLKVFGLGESLLEEKIKQLQPWCFPPISYIARGYEVDLQIKGYGNLTLADQMIDEAERVLRKHLGDYIFGTDDDTQAGIVANLFINSDLTLSLAESCSGGLLSDQITDIPGSSTFYRGCLVVYSNEAKINLLGIDDKELERDGPVSAVTAKSMAKKVRTIFNTDLGLAVTGLAGPDGDDRGNPAGLVFIALSTNMHTFCREFRLIGSRRAVKERASQVALEMLRKELLSILKGEGAG